MSNLDGRSADRELFLLKVPAYIADSWKKMIHDSMRPQLAGNAQPGASTSASATGANALGWISLDEAGQQHLELSSAASEGERLPKRYKLNEQGQIMPQSHIVAQTAAGYRCEGRVSQLLTAQPNLDNGQFDQRYMQLTGERDRLANTATGEIRLNTEQVRVLSMASARFVTSTAKRKDHKRSLTREEFEAQRSSLQAEIFTLFERLQNWTLAKLMKETGLAATYLKEILQDIAILNKRGPYKDQWTIKKEFLENPDAPPDGAAAQANS